VHDCCQSFRYGVSSRGVQMPITETGEPRAEVESIKLRNRHAKIGVPVGIDGETLKPRDRLTDSAIVASAYRVASNNG
jgi:hypothetical protein